MGSGARFDWLETERLIMRRWQESDRQGFGFWALEIAATGTFIGFTGLNPLPDGVPGAGGMEVGWRLRPQVAYHGTRPAASKLP
jgi:RimJ/RimL family protein N-acetyltransferase